MYNGYYYLNTGKEIIVEAIDLLTNNAKNLIHAVEEVLYATERAIIKLPASEKERLNLIHQTTPDSLSTPHLGISKIAFLCLNAVIERCYYATAVLTIQMPYLPLPHCLCCKHPKERRSRSSREWPPTGVIWVPSWTLIK